MLEISQRHDVLSHFISLVISAKWWPFQLILYPPSTSLPHHPHVPSTMWPSLWKKKKEKKKHTHTVHKHIHASKWHGVGWDLFFVTLHMLFHAPLVIYIYKMYIIKTWCAPTYTTMEYTHNHSHSLFLSLPHRLTKWLDIPYADTLL